MAHRVVLRVDDVDTVDDEFLHQKKNRHRRLIVQQHCGR